MADTSAPLSAVSICNFAVDTLDEQAITSLDDNTKFARFCVRQYGYTRDELLRMYPWCFAEEYQQLAPDATAPPFTWTYSYTMPNGWLRLLPLTECGRPNGRSLKFKKVGQKIYTNYGPTLNVRGIKSITDETQFDVLYARALGQFLAYRASQLITGKAGYVPKTQQMFQDAMQAAMQADSLERGTPETVENDYGTQDVLAARGLGCDDSYGYVPLIAY